MKSMIPSATGTEPRSYSTRIFYGLTLAVVESTFLEQMCYGYILLSVRSCNCVVPWWIESVCTLVIDSSLRVPFSYCQLIESTLIVTFKTRVTIFITHCHLHMVSPCSDISTSLTLRHGKPMLRHINITHCLFRHGKPMLRHINITHSPSW
jgi:hypothetical protein